MQPVGIPLASLKRGEMARTKFTEVEGSRHKEKPTPKKSAPRGGAKRSIGSCKAHIFSSQVRGRDTTQEETVPTWNSCSAWDPKISKINRYSHFMLPRFWVASLVFSCLHSFRASFKETAIFKSCKFSLVFLFRLCTSTCFNIDIEQALGARSCRALLSPRFSAMASYSHHGITRGATRRSHAHSQGLRVLSRSLVWGRESLRYSREASHCHGEGYPGTNYEQLFLIGFVCLFLDDAHLKACKENSWPSSWLGLILHARCSFASFPAAVLEGRLDCLCDFVVAFVLVVTSLFANLYGFVLFKIVPLLSSLRIRPHLLYRSNPSSSMYFNK